MIWSDLIQFRPIWNVLKYFSTCSYINNQTDLYTYNKTIQYPTFISSHIFHYFSICPHINIQTDTHISNKTTQIHNLIYLSCFSQYVHIWTSRRTHIHPITHIYNINLKVSNISDYHPFMYPSYYIYNCIYDIPYMIHIYFKYMLIFVQSCEQLNLSLIGSSMIPP